MRMKRCRVLMRMLFDGGLQGMGGRSSACEEWGICSPGENWLKEGHKRYPWRFCPDSNRIFHHQLDGSMEAYSDQSRNRFEETGENLPAVQSNVVCTVEEMTAGVYRKINDAPLPSQPLAPNTLWEVLDQWGSMWMWEDLEISGGFECLAAAIADGSLTTVADGSFIKEMYPDICSAAFIMECSKGRGRLIGKFSERTLAACAYRGELLGLLAIHLILLAINKLSPSLEGSVQIIYSDCLGALTNVENLPPHRLPTGCKHSDILKTIMVHCRELTFHTEFSHVSAHKLDHLSWEELSRPEQLNEQCDSGAKMAIYEVDPNAGAVAQPLPLESVCVYANGGQEKLTTDTGARIRFHSLALAKEIFVQKGILTLAAFTQVDWSNVNIALHGVPRLFQLWACKQVHNIAGTNQRLHKQGDSRDPWCPSCLEEVETCAHVLTCNEEDRVKCFQMSANNLQSWLQSVGTCEVLEECIVEFVRARNSKSFMECVAGSRDPRVIKLARLQDKIGGMLAVEKKEDLQVAIEEQQAMGLEGLAEEDKYLMEISLGDLETTSGEYQAYWLLAVKSARNAYSLRRQELLSKQTRIEMGVCFHSRANDLYLYNLACKRLIDEI